MIEAGFRLMGGGAAAELATVGGGTIPVVVVEVAGGAVVVVGGAIVAEGAVTAVSEAQMLRAAFSAKKRPQPCPDYGGAPDPGRLRKLTTKEVQKYGLEEIKQEEGVPAPADLYTDPFTGRIYYRVKGGPSQYLTDVPELKTRQR